MLIFHNKDVEYFLYKKGEVGKMHQTKAGWQVVAHLPVVVTAIFAG